MHIRRTLSALALTGAAFGAVTIAPVTTATVGPVEVAASAQADAGWRWCRPMPKRPTAYRNEVNATAGRICVGSSSNEMELECQLQVRTGYTRQLDPIWKDWNYQTIDDEPGEKTCAHTVVGKPLAGKVARTCSRVLIVGEDGVVLRREAWSCSGGSLIRIR